MKRIILISLLVWSVSSPLFSLNLQEGLWTDFSGKLGNSNFYLSLYRTNGDSITGSYFIDGATKKIQVAGTFKNEILFLKERNQSNQLAIFKGKVYSTTQDDFIRGFRMERNGGKAQRFDIHVSSMVGGTAEKRYSNVKLADEIVENFALQVKAAFLQNKKEWLAQQIIYPLDIRLGNGQTKSLKNANEFISNFAQIAHAGFKKQLSTVGCFNLFHNYQGIMMGNGEIWLDCDAEQNSMKIVGVNN